MIRPSLEASRTRGQVGLCPRPSALRPLHAFGLTGSACTGGGEISNEPLLERSVRARPPCLPLPPSRCGLTPAVWQVRHGDPGDRGPGHYGIPEYRPRCGCYDSSRPPALFLTAGVFWNSNPDDLTNCPVPADNPGRPSSAFEAVPRSDKDYRTTAGHVESTWSMAQDARLWTVGGQTGASIGGLASAADRFDYELPSAVKDGVPWASGYTMKKAIRQLRRRARREQERSRKGKGRARSQNRPGSATASSAHAEEAMRSGLMSQSYQEMAKSLRRPATRG